MEQILVTYFGILLEQFQWDVAVMSEPWMYWCALVPITIFLVFFVLKWTVLTAPIWIPIAYAAGFWQRRK